jgi:hypothetical protein
MATKKSFWKSKTFWFNIIGLGLTYGLPALGVPLPVDPVALIGALSAGNIGLRAVTKEPVAIIGK